jgi:membrane protein implicated in regulation of membrane protease activity
MMEYFYFWCTAFAVLLGLELMTGSFYLLMLALGAASAAALSYFNSSVAVQILTASLVGVGAVSIWHWRRSQRLVKTSSSPQDIHLDVGAHVQVDGWQSDQTSRVNYRGAQWAARLGDDQSASSLVPGPGIYRIREISGNSLILEPLT